MDAMMKLGDVKFTISGPYYDALRKQDEYRWATMERVGRRPAKQFMGRGEEVIEITGTIITVLNPGGADDYVGTKSLQGLRAGAEKGEPQMLVDGSGNIYGLFVVTRISEDQSIFFSNGAPRQQGFSVSLERYGEDNLGDATPMVPGGPTPA